MSRPEIDQFGPVLPMRFFGHEYRVQQRAGPRSGTYVAHAETRVRPSGDLVVVPEIGSAYGHLALYAAYLHQTEKRNVILEINEDLELKLRWPFYDRSQFVPAYMSPREIDQRFVVIETEVPLTAGEEPDIALAGLDLIVRCGRLAEIDRTRAIQHQSRRAHG